MGKLRTIIAALLLTSAALQVSAKEKGKPVVKPAEKTDETGPKRNTAIKLNLYSLMVNATTELSIQQSFNGNMAAQLALSYQFRPDKDYDTDYKEFTFTPEYRFYFDEAKTAPSGIYLAPYVRYLHTVGTVKGAMARSYSKTSETLYGGGFAMGYQYVRSNGLTFDAFMGAGRVGGSMVVKSPAGENKYNKKFFGEMRFGISVGYAF
ncbi:MAG: DUF3575 domain-containing protein [Bacteroidota bacterium]